MKPIIVTCCGNQIVNSKAGDDTIVQDVRFVPTGNAFFVELVYKFKSMPKVLLNKSNALGINNLATLISNQPAVQPVLVNGKMIKSVKRLCWINDYLHKVSRFIINYALMADAGTLVIGHNFEWKKSINIGKLNNQKFVSIPHARLIEMIHYKADETGLTVIVREESYVDILPALWLHQPLCGKGEASTHLTHSGHSRFKRSYPDSRSSPP